MLVVRVSPDYFAKGEGAHRAGGVFVDVMLSCSPPAAASRANSICDSSMSIRFQAISSVVDPGRSGKQVATTPAAGYYGRTSGSRACHPR